MLKERAPMIFIGIFGIKELQKKIATLNNVVCPACQALTRSEIFRSDSCFHIFFIPLIKWNTRYYAKAACCSSVFEIDATQARQLEEGQITEIKPEYLHPLNSRLPYQICSSCQARVESGFSFCPYCGRKLQ
jgi:hypothetical protein